MKFFWEKTPPPPPPPPPPPGSHARHVYKEESKGDDIVDRSGKIQSVGRVEFPNSRRPAARWMRVAPIPNMPKGTTVEPYDSRMTIRVRAAFDPSAGHVDVNGAERAVETREAAMRGIVTHFLKKFHLPPPSVLISVNGGADTLDITPKQKAVFRHGLLDAAKQASAGGDDDEVKSAAWIITSGTDSGVMELVGKTMHGLDEVRAPLWTPAARPHGDDAFVWGPPPRLP